MFYRYAGRDLATQDAVSGVCRADTIRDAVAHLKRDGVRITAIAPRKDNARLSTGAKKARIAFFRGYAALAGAGMQNEEIISFMRQTVRSQSSSTLSILRRTMANIKRATKSGAGIAEAMTREPDLFTTVDCAIVAAALEAGKLPATLEEYAGRLEEDLDFDSAVRSALIQPAITLVGAAFVFPFVASSLTPTLDSLYRTFAIEPPPSFEQMRFIGHLAGTPWLWLGYTAIAAGAVLLWRGGRLTPLLRRLPLAGELLSARSTEVAARTLAQAYAAGKSPATACSYAASAIDDPRIARAFDACADALIHGRASSLAEAMDQQRDGFEPLFVQYVKMGRDARIPEMAEHAAREARRTVRELIARLPNLINTATVLFAGALVGLIAIYVYTAVSHAVGHVLGGGPANPAL